MKKIKLIPQLIILLLVISVTLLFLLSMFNDSKERIISQYQNQQQVLVRQTILSIKSYLDERIRAIEVLSDFPASKKLEAKIYLTEYERTFEKVGGFENILFVDIKGNIKEGYPNNSFKPHNIFSDTSLFGNLKHDFEIADSESKALVTEAHTTSNNVRAVYVLSPIQNNNKLLGYILGKIPIPGFLPKQVEPILSGFDGHLWIIQTNGEVVYHSVHNNEKEINILRPVKKCFTCHNDYENEKRVLALNEGSVIRTGRNHDQVTTFATLKMVHLDWRIGVSTSEKKLEGLITSIGRDFLLYGLFVLIVSVGFIASFIIQTTRREKAEYELESQKQKAELEQRYHSLVENIPVGIFVMKDSKFVLVNNSMEKIFGYSKNEFLSNTIEWSTIILKDDLEKLLAALDSVSNPNQDTQMVEVKGYGKNKTVLDLVITCFPANIGEDFVVQGSVRDITLLKQYEAEKKQKDNLVLIGEMGARLAHEIKNPLASIQTGVQLLKSKFKNQENEEEFCNRIISEIKRMDNTIKSILYFSRESELNLTNTDLRRTIKHVLALNESVLQEKNITINTSFANDFPILSVDEEKWKQIFWNLLNNSIQSIESNGTINISFTKSESKVIIEFEDSGKGIGSGNYDNIFKPFFSTKAQGTGLGLSITKSLIELHKGKISASESALKGAKFTIELPLKNANE